MRAFSTSLLQRLSLPEMMRYMHHTASPAGKSSLVLLLEHEFSVQSEEVMDCQLAGRLICGALFCPAPARRCP